MPVPDPETTARFFMQEDSSCLYKYDLRAKALPQRAQVCGLVFECVWMCARRLLLSAKAFSQTLHLKGFSPVWVRMWPWRSHGLEKHLPQVGHSQPWLWVLTCIEYAGIETYTFSQ